MSNTIITLPIRNPTAFTSPGLGVFENPASILFDGINDYIGFGDNYGFGPATAFSMSFWVKPQNLAAQRCFISKTTNDTNVYGIGIYHDATGKIFIQLRASGALRQHTFGDTLIAGSWQLITVTFDGSSNMNGLNVYIDDALDSNSPASSNSLGDFTNTDPLEIGRRNSGFYYSGNMNNVCFWDKELSLTEVEEIYNSGTPGDLDDHADAANRLSWWYFNNGDNFPTEVDQVGSVNGTLNNWPDAETAYDDGDVP